MRVSDNRSNQGAVQYIDALMREVAIGFRPILKSIAFVISRLTDGISDQQLSYYLSKDLYNDEFVQLCLTFSDENGWLARLYDGGRYSLTVMGENSYRVSSVRLDLVEANHTKSLLSLHNYKVYRCCPTN
jgi:hypothetical protein